MSPGLLGGVPISGFDAHVIFGCPGSDAPNIVAFIRSESSRGAFTGSDDRLVLRSPQAQPPVAIAIKVDVDPALGIQFVLGESVKQVDEGAACTERPAAESA